MKTLVYSFSFLIVLVIFTGCGGNRGLQEVPPAQFQQAYYTTDASSIQLFLPVSAIQTDRVSLNSVYFQGRKAPLERDPQRPGVYKANFHSGKRDMIMHEDPREEYGNKIPEDPEEVPFDLDDDEAVVVFTENDEVKYYKLTGIENRTGQ